MSGADMTSGLYPEPRSLRVEEAAAAGEQVTVIDDSSLPTQGYSIRADADGVVVRHTGAAGHRYAASTLRQLRAVYGGRLPRCEVVDWPDLPVRGFLLDVSRGRVPTRETLARLVGLLELGRYNHLQLHVEHAFAYAHHSTVWRGSSPLTGADLVWLDDTCSAAGIELAANQSSFGHFGRWLAHETYRSRAECPSGWEPVPGHPAPPTVLAPRPENADFVLSLLHEQLGFLSSDTVNIGCDETFELGWGRSRDRVVANGVGSVFVEHVNRIARPLLQQGRRVLAWGDMLAKHPEALPLLDKAVTSLVWSYEAPGATPPELSPRQAKLAQALGFEGGAPPDFASLVEPHVDAGRDFWVCPGTSTWNSFVGRGENARANLLDAAVAGRDSGASGYLVTDWGDNGHLQPPSASFAPLLYGAAVAWCARTNSDLDVAPVLDREVFADVAERLGGSVELLASAAAATGIPALNASPLFSRVLPKALSFVASEVDARGAAAALEALDAGLAALTAARPQCADGDLVVAELQTAARLARVGALRLLGAAGAPRSVDEQDLQGLLDDVRSCWLARSRPGEMDESLRPLREGLDAGAEGPAG
ncbi:MAG: glycoside hydrolase family 20 zincin-like fold domain-containing protein [Mycobacteriales bacterium]